MTLLAIPALLVALAVTIIVVAMIWAWRNGTSYLSEQEHVDFEFERIVRRLESPLR
jgi:hypothetical protein